MSGLPGQGRRRARGRGDRGGRALVVSRVTCRPCRSASACSATPSWARRTRARFARCASSTRRSCPSSSRSPGATASELEAVAARFGWAEAVTDWREQVADDRIELYVNGGPNALHAEPSIAALEAGKHVLCEKPLGLDADESYRMWQAAEAPGVVHACGFNYRFVPAIRRARELLEAGAVGDIVHFRARYLQSWGWDADTSIWRFDRAQAGDRRDRRSRRAHHRPGALPRRRDRDASPRVVRTYVPGHEVDDAFVASIELAGGAIGTLEATRLARGRINQNDLRDQRLGGLDRLRPASASTSCRSPTDGAASARSASAATGGRRAT